MRNEDLLKPTLSVFSKAPALYHPTGLALAAFFGGPLGASIYAFANSARLNRLAQDAPVILALCAAAFLLPLELARLDGLRPLVDFLGVSAPRAIELLLRALGLLCFGAIYLMHRRFFRSARIASVKPLPGWVPGISAVIAGYLANLAFTAWILKHH